MNSERHTLFYEKLWEYRRKVQNSMQGKISYLVRRTLSEEQVSRLIDAGIMEKFYTGWFEANCEEYMWIRSSLAGDYSGPLGVLYGNGIPHGLKYATGEFQIKLYTDLRDYLLNEFPELKGRTDET